MPEENIQDFLRTYLNHANQPSLSIEQLTLEFNLFTAYINLSKFQPYFMLIAIYGINSEIPQQACARDFNHMPPCGKSVICYIS